METILIATDGSEPAQAAGRGSCYRLSTRPVLIVSAGTVREPTPAA